MQIRKTTIEDLKTVLDLNHALFLHDNPFDPILDNEWPYSADGKKYFEPKVSGKDGICFLAEHDGKALGYLAGSVIDADKTRSNIVVANLDNMMVATEHQGKGIGTKLVSEFVKWAKANKAERIDVSAYAGNKDAIKFYEKIGFKPLSISLEHDLTE